MNDLEINLTDQINQLSNVELTPDLIDRINIGQLGIKAKELVKSLNDSSQNLEDLVNQGKFETFYNSFGTNNKILANSEKAVVDSIRFNIGLSCLLVLFSKAIKGQQDQIITQQEKLEEHQQKLEEQSEEMLKIQGLTQEQAGRIVQLLQADVYVAEKIATAKKEIEHSINVNQKNIDSKFHQLCTDFNQELLSLQGQVSQIAIEVREEFETKLNRISEQGLEQFKTVDSRLKEFSDLLSAVNVDFRETLNNNKKTMENRFRWSIVFSGLLAILVIFNILWAF